jgi:hypothetical protein
MQLPMDLPAAPHTLTSVLATRLPSLLDCTCPLHTKPAGGQLQMGKNHFFALPGARISYPISFKQCAALHGWHCLSEKAEYRRLPKSGLPFTYMRRESPIVVPDTQKHF